jgi:hypothetical protein
MSSYQNIKNLQPRTVRNIKEFDIIAKGQIKGLEKVEKRVDKLYNNSFLISLELDGIERWEKIYDLEPLGSFEMRRNAIIAYSQGRGKLSSTKIKNMAYSYGAERVTVRFNKDKSTLEVETFFPNGVYLELNMFLEILEELKPARLMINYKAVSERRDTIHIASCLVSGEEITVYPWSVDEIISKGEINIGLIVQDTELMTLYPKGDI